MTEVPAAKNVTRNCPLISCAITWVTHDATGKETRHYDLARSPCLRGECELFDIKRFCCGLKRVEP